MAQTIADSYAIGSPNYNAIQASQGTAAANAAYQAAITAEANGTPMDDSFFDALGSQLYNDPLGAPLQQFGTLASNTADDVNAAGAGIIGSLFKNPITLLAVLAVLFGVFLYFGGGALLKRRTA